ncbi:MAG: O-antigen ligase family protein, partial [Chloroflexota bacterium]|nr:O-antigen ligase family protein [Chloroflexota bacterium]
AALLGLVWCQPWSGVLLFVAVIAVLPFGVIPVPVAGAQLTLVDAMLLATYSAVLGRSLFGRRPLPLGTTGVALLGLAMVMCAAFVASAATSAAPPELVRRVAKLIAGVLFFVVARALLVQPGRVEQLLRWLMVAGAIQGAVGGLLTLLPPPTQLALLSSLRVVGYPTTDVLRYVPGPNDTYTTQLRAIGTSVDPNVFGGTLMLALTCMIVQWSCPRPVLQRPLLLLLALPTSLGVLLSLSRASWLGLAVALLLVGFLRYRRILGLAALAAAALLLTRAGQDVVQRFVRGLSAADRATAFRLGEYANAWTLIQRYPLLGIGFGLSPDIDVTAGVSSVYLLVAEQTGLIGLALFLLAVGSAWVGGLRALGRVEDARRQSLIATLLAAVSAALVAGLLDHYFANHLFPHAVALFWLYVAALTRVSEAD